MSSLLAGYLPNYEPKEVTFTPIPGEQTFPWSSAFKPKVLTASMSSSSSSTSPPSPPKKRVRKKRGGKRRIIMPETCWVPGCQGHMRVGRGGTAAGFCAQHWRALPRLLRIELLLGRIRRERFDHFLKQAFAALGVAATATQTETKLAEPSEKR